MILVLEDRYESSLSIDTKKNYWYHEKLDFTDFG